MLKNELFGPIKQWGFLVKDLDKAMASWVEQLGVGPFWGFRNVALSSHYKGLDSQFTDSQININVGLAYQNGVQIELIHQTDTPITTSPYSAFYKTNQEQIFQHVAYHCFDIEQGRQTAKKAGLRELGYVESAMATRYYYYDSPMLNGIIVELMEVDQMLVDAFELCAEQAESWQGEEPYRLISM